MQAEKMTFTMEDVNMKGLNLMLKLTDMLRDDALFCETEYNIINHYVNKKGLLNISPEEWDIISIRGYCCEAIAGFHIEAGCMTGEEERRMAARLFKESQEAELDSDGGIAKRLHWWDRGTTPGYIQQDIKYLFPEV